MQNLTHWNFRSSMSNITNASHINDHIGNVLSCQYLLTKKINPLEKNNLQDINIILEQIDRLFYVSSECCESQYYYYKLIARMDLNGNNNVFNNCIGNNDYIYIDLTARSNYKECFCFHSTCQCFEFLLNYIDGSMFITKNVYDFYNNVSFKYKCYISQSLIKNDNIYIENIYNSNVEEEEEEEEEERKIEQENNIILEIIIMRKK